MAIRFLEEYTVDSTPPVTHKINSVLNCNNATAEHFINKGVAVRDEKREAPRVPKSAPGSSASQADPALPEKTAKRSRGRPKLSQ